MTIKKKICFVLVGVGMIALSSCSTVNGIGQDIKRAGNAISNSSR